MSCQANHCALKRQQKGGSMASDNVLQNVNCSTFNTIDATNMFGGSSDKIHMGGQINNIFAKMEVFNKGGAKPTNKRKRTKTQKGGECNHVGDIFSRYSIGPLTVPSTLPEQNVLMNVPANVLTTLAQNTPYLDSSYAAVTYPTYISDSGINLKVGGCGCRR